MHTGTIEIDILIKNWNIEEVVYAYYISCFGNNSCYNSSFFEINTVINFNMVLSSRSVWCFAFWSDGYWVAIWIVQNLVEINLKKAKDMEVMVHVLLEIKDKHKKGGCSPLHNHVMQKPQTSSKDRSHFCCIVWHCYTKSFYQRKLII